MAVSTGFPKLDAVLEQDADFLEVLSDRAQPAEQVSMFLKQVGHAVSASTIRTFRRSLDRGGKCDPAFTD